MGLQKPFKKKEHIPSFKTIFVCPFSHISCPLPYIFSGRRCVRKMSLQLKKSGCTTPLSFLLSLLLCSCVFQQTITLSFSCGSPHIFLIPLVANIKKSEEKIIFSVLLHPSACPFTSVSHYVCALFPFLLHPPQSRTHSFAFARGGPGLSLLLQTSIHRCYPALFRPLFLLLICCPPHLSVHFSFLLFVPISSAQMRCCVPRRVCTFLITSSCLGISWAKWSCNETEYCCANTHQPGL